MFVLSYLIVVLIAALPLTLTVLQNRGNPPSIILIHRIYRDLAYIVVVVVAIIAIEAIFTIALQNYWFGELGQQYRYWLALGLRAAVFGIVFIFGGLFIGFNLRSG